MSETTREIFTQPAVWREAVKLAGTARDALPVAGDRVLAVGCGTSYHMALAASRLRESLGMGESDTATPSQLPERNYDSFLVVSRSGTTTEILGAMDWARKKGLRVIALTAVEASPVAELAHDAVVLDFADESSVVQTRFATGALSLLRAHLGEDVEALASQAEERLTLALQVEPADFERFVFLAQSWAVGLAHEAALKVREAASAWSESYAAPEYRHGPMSATSDRTLVWGIGAVDGAIMSDARQAGATVVGSSCDPMVALVDVQRLAVALAEARGLDPDRPRFLNRSVVLSRA
ncbi:MAG: SIS domain-containing protein [Acidimicrobiales bacterium]